MKKKIKYVGSYSGIEVPDFGIRVDRDEPIEVKNATAEALTGRSDWVETKSDGSSLVSLQKDNSR